MDEPDARLSVQGRVLTFDEWLEVEKSRPKRRASAYGAEYWRFPAPPANGTPRAEVSGASEGVVEWGDVMPEWGNGAASGVATGDGVAAGMVAWEEGTNRGDGASADPRADRPAALRDAVKEFAGLLRSGGVRAAKASAAAAPAPGAQPAASSAELQALHARCAALERRSARLEAILAALLAAQPDLAASLPRGLQPRHDAAGAGDASPPAALLGSAHQSPLIAAAAAAASSASAASEAGLPPSPASSVHSLELPQAEA